MFNVWDRLETNEFADTVTIALAALFPEDPPRFLARTPHGYHDAETIKRDLAAGGFPPHRRSRHSRPGAGRRLANVPPPPIARAPHCETR